MLLRPGATIAATNGQTFFAEIEYDDARSSAFPLFYRHKPGSRGVQDRCDQQRLPLRLRLFLNVGAAPWHNLLSMIPMDLDPPIRAESASLKHAESATTLSTTGPTEFRCR
jgi:hypothetical protein